jgi:hypothetical protein
LAPGFESHCEPVEPVTLEVGVVAVVVVPADELKIGQEGAVEGVLVVGTGFADVSVPSDACSA